MQTQPTSVFAFVLVPLKRMLEVARARWRIIGTSYKPEKHYMRGPGPKWREKRAPATATARRPSEAAGGR
jgi:hypothetical protein